MGLRLFPFGAHKALTSLGGGRPTFILANVGRLRQKVQSIYLLRLMVKYS